MANDDPVPVTSTPMDQEPPAPIEALHSPYHARTIYRDMEILRQSRQDNPYLKFLSSSSHTHLNISTSSDQTDSADAIATDLHARLIRSPPPIMWNRKSEPSFSKLDLDSRCVFQFPPAGDGRPAPGGCGAYSSSQKGGMVMEGKLGLSPGRRTAASYRQQ